MKRNDLILGAAVIVAAAVLLIFQLVRSGDSAAQIRVTVDGELYGTYDLSEDQTVSINDTNRLVIENGSARMEWADCPDQICVSHRAVTRDGESIICLPNEVVVSVEDSRADTPEEEQIDGIVQ